MTKKLRPIRWTHIIVHHTAGAPQTTMEQLRAMHRAKGRVDVGYHYVLLRSRVTGYRRGYLHVGRDACRVGGHAGSLAWNRRALGFAVVGNFHGDGINSERMGRELWLDVVSALVHLCLLYEIPAENVIAHRDVAKTSCPGDLFPWAELKKVLPAALERAKKATRKAKPSSRSGASAPD